MCPCLWQHVDGRVIATRDALRRFACGMKRSSSAATTSIGQRTRVASIANAGDRHVAAGAAAVGNHLIEHRILQLRRHAIQHDLAQDPRGRA